MSLCWATSQAAGLASFSLRRWPTTVSRQFTKPAIFNTGEIDWACRGKPFESAWAGLTPISFLHFWIKPPSFSSRPLHSRPHRRFHSGSEVQRLLISGAGGAQRGVGSAHAGENGAMVWLVGQSESSNWCEFCSRVDVSRFFNLFFHAQKKKKTVPFPVSFTICAVHTLFKSHMLV